MELAVQSPTRYEDNADAILGVPSTATPSADDDDKTSEDSTRHVSSCCSAGDGQSRSEGTDGPSPDESMRLAMRAAVGSSDCGVAMSGVAAAGWRDATADGLSDCEVSTRSEEAQGVEVSLPRSRPGFISSDDVERIA